MSWWIFFVKKESKPFVITLYMTDICRNKLNYFMIAFLHTSSIHIDKFEKLVRLYDKEIQIQHFVNEDLLSSALKKGKTDTTTFGKEVAKMKEKQPSLLICTCSTYGEECDNNDLIERIDEPIAAFLVSNFTKIGLAFTANSTKKVSENLLKRIASTNDKTIEIIECDCSSAWKYYEFNDFVNYEKSIAENLKKMENEVEVVFLAQASMEGCRLYLNHFSKEIYSSPEYGVKHFITAN